MSPRDRHEVRDSLLALSRDHRAVLERLDEVGRLLARARGPMPRVGSAALSAAVDLIALLERRLPPHFELEERILPAPAAGACDDHADLADGLSTLASLRARITAGERCDAELLENVARFADRLRAHIADEERLFRELRSQPGVLTAER